MPLDPADFSISWGEKMGVPIYVRCEEASKTWYIDTLVVT